MSLCINLDMYMAIVISFLNYKGGCGKTTITVNVATGLVNRGIKTVVADTDPMGSSRRWSEKNDGSLVTILGLDRESLVADINAIKPNYQVVLLDGAAGYSGSPKLGVLAVKVSDVVIIPILPGGHDVEEAGEIVEMIKLRQEVTDGKSPKAIFLINRRRKSKAIEDSVMRDLTAYGFPVMNAQLSHWVEYPDCSREGKSIFCSGESKAASEMNSVIEEIIARFLPQDIYLGKTKQ